MAHTKGPWESSDSSVWGVSAWNARVRLATIIRHAPMNGIDSDANLRLMTAAPDLLVALEFLLEHEGERETNHVGIEFESELLEHAKELARKAIKKATGEN